MASWESLKASADAAYKQQNFARAHSLYNTILEDHAAEIDQETILKVRGNRGLASQKQGQGAPAVEDALTVLAASETTVANVTNWFRLGIALLTAKLPAEAIEALNIAVEIDPKNADAAKKLKKAKQDVRVVTASGKPGGPFQDDDDRNSQFQQDVRSKLAVCKQLRKGLQANGMGNGTSPSSEAKRPATPENEAHKAKRPSSSSSAANVENEDANVTNNEPETAKSPAQLAEQLKATGADLYKQGRYAEAIEAYGKAIEHSPDNAVLYSNRSLASLMKGDYMQAVNDGRVAITKDPTFARGYHRAAKAYITMGKFDQAEESFTQALQVDSKDQAAKDGLQLIDRLASHLQAGTKSYESGDARQALWHADLALRETNPACETAQFLRAKALASLGRHSEALQESRNLTFEGNAGSAEAFTARAEILYMSGNMTMAEKAFQQVLRMDPDCKEARKALRQLRTINSAKEAGNEAFKSRELRKAVEQYTIAIDTDPLLKNTFMSQCYANRCAANLGLEQYTKAVEDADKAVELDDTNVKAIHRRATANMKLQNYDAAVRDFEKVKEMSPDMDGISQSLKNAKTELKKSKRIDYYKLLGVSPSATTDEIKRAYKKAALKNHPDKVPQEEREAAEKRFQQINNGHALLTDEDKRAKYDAGWTEEEISQGMQEGGMGGMGGFGAGGIDPEILAQLFGQRGGGMGGFGGGGGGFHGFSSGGHPGYSRY